MDNLWNLPLEAPPRRQWTREEKLELFKLKREGHSLMELACRYGSPPYEIREALQEIGAEIMDSLLPRGEKRRKGVVYKQRTAPQKPRRPSLGKLFLTMSFRCK